MSDATTAAPAAPAPDATASAPAAAPAPDATTAPAAAPASTAAPAPAATPAPTAAPAGAPKADDKPAGVPEAYEAFTLPEGVKLDDAVMGEFQQLAKDLGLPQDKAQKLVDLGAKMQTGNAAALQARVEAQGNEWAAAVMADKEIGGDKLQENLAVSKRALEQFATPEFTAFLNTTKLGNHPEMLRTFYRIGQAISQDGFVPGRAGAGTADARKLFANSNMNP